jgi:hypothetical protein
MEAGEGVNGIIDIQRLNELEYTCPECCTVRNMPHGWQDMARDSLPFREALQWDGNLRCRFTSHCVRADLRGTVMTEAAVQYFTAAEPDGSFIVHLTETGNRERAWCTGQRWRLPHDIPQGTVMRQCQACLRLVVRG